MFKAIASDALPVVGDDGLIGFWFARSQCSIPTAACMSGNSSERSTAVDLAAYWLALSNG
jgi:hypothetical protein